MFLILIPPSSIMSVARGDENGRTVELLSKLAEVKGVYLEAQSIRL